MDLESGHVLLHYRLVEKLGEGGMGVVWKAVDTTLDREVAIKILPAEFSSDPERLARFESEAKTVASLNHPNIAAVYSVHRHEDMRFLAMELVRGEDLAAVLERGRPAVSEALLIGRQIAEALEAAHENGVIHRDLKPANVQLTPEGQAKVLDFGLAKATDRRPGASNLSLSPTITSMGTVVGTILGTAAYMSPEQARGKSVDKRADIWAFGCLLYEMLAGRQVFEGETVTDLLGAIMHRDPAWSELPGNVPPSIVRLIRRCLQRDPRQRQRDIGDARIVIEEALAGASDPGAQPATAAGASRAARLSMLVATAVLAAVLGALAVWTARPERTGAPLRKFDLRVTGADSSTDLTSVEISPDGRHVVFTHQNRLWVRDLEGIKPLLLAGSEGASAPFWSPDGEWIGFGRGRGIEKIARTGGEATRIAATDALSDVAGGSAVWTGDGKIVWTSASAGLFQVSAQGGKVTTLLEPAEGESDFHEVCGLPGGGFAFIVHLSSGDYPRLGAVTASGERRDVFTADSGNLLNLAYAPSGHLIFQRSGTVPGLWALPLSATSYEAAGEPFLIAAEGDAPSVADDGTLAYLHRGAPHMSRLVWVDRDGGNPTPIGEPLESLFPFPDLSADESKVLITGLAGDGKEVFAYQTRTGTRQQLTFSGLRNDMAVWVPGKEQILAHRSSPFTLRLTSLDGSEPDRALGPGLTPALTADRSHLVFAKQKANAWDFDIYIREWDADHDAAEPLIEGPGAIWFPQVSPSGHALAYTSDAGGQDEVFVTPFPAADRRWQVSRDGGSFPKWSGDGLEIYYARDDAIYAVELGPSGKPAGEPRLLFTRKPIKWVAAWTDGFDVTADGQRFVIAEDVSVGDEPPSIVIVQNWLAEFE